MTTRNDPKLTASRLARRAIVYVRQSSQKQVQHNHESRELQYALVERARALGWSRTEVIDHDLGQSAGLAAAQREGFERLLAAVALGEVGIVLSREASRLSRTDKDWCRLLELCQIFDTLIGDGEQVYDLALLDDQLVLGIKGTLSVVELKVIRQRMLAGMYHKASKGKHYRMLAPGYVLDGLGDLVKDPNQRVQQAIAIVFKAFRETSSIRQTVKWFHEHGVEVPVNKVQDGKHCIVFRLPTASSIHGVLHNPIYGGAYVFGRRPVEIRMVDGVRFVIHGKGGAHTRFEMPKPLATSTHRTTSDDLDIIRRMAVRYGDDQIANVLNRLGRRTGKGLRWSEHRVATARKSHGIAGQARTKVDPEILSLNGAAKHAGVSDTTIRRLVQAGLLPFEQIAPRAPWEIRREDLDKEPVRGILAHLLRTGTLDLGRNPTGPDPRSLFLDATTRGVLLARSPRLTQENKLEQEAMHHE